MLIVHYDGIPKIPSNNANCLPYKEVIYPAGRGVWRAAYTKRNPLINVPAATVQQTQYYPSGLPWASNATDNPDIQARKYNGKEFIEMHGYDVTDLGWRTDYNATFRFTTLDRKSEKYPWQSPYCVAADNPVRYNDKNGEAPGDPNSGGTPAVDEDNKKTTAQSTTAVNVPDIIESVSIPEGTYIKPPDKSIFDPTWEGGNADAANQQTPNQWTKQEITGGLGIVGVIFSAGTLGELAVAGASFASYIFPTLGLLNSIDDAGTNKKFESLSQQMTNDPKTKNVIANVKGAISIVGAATSIIQPLQTPVPVDM